MKKHAYLIMAHNNWYCLEKLLMMLDDERNDIFLHIDAKVKDYDFEKYQHLCQKARLIYPRKRIKVYWGTQSQVLTEMLLFETAYSYGPYHYYHLLSGADLPLKTQDEIHSFFEDKSKSYLFYRENPSKWNQYRISRYNNLFGRGNPLSERMSGYADLIQEKLSVDRMKKTGMKVQKGYNWCSLNQEAVEVLLANKTQIKKMTRFSICADEVYKQTILLHLGCEVESCDMRLVDWAGGNHPRTYTMDDWEMLISSDRLFARKFDEKVDRQIIDRIVEYIRQKDCREKKV